MRLCRCARKGQTAPSLSSPNRARRNPTQAVCYLCGCFGHAAAACVAKPVSSLALPSHSAGPVRLLHRPVLVAETLAALRTNGCWTAGSVLCDLTFGAGGHTRELLAADPSVTVLALDCDPQAQAIAAAFACEAPGRVVPLAGRFSDIAALFHARSVPHNSIAGALIDMGVSSMQSDTAARGFSFRHDGPLDMRMSQSGTKTAAQLLATLSHPDLVGLLSKFGHEPHAQLIAAAIVSSRASAPLTTTSQLAALVASVVPATGTTPTPHTRSSPHHPATRTFQALRIAVNDELNDLKEAFGQIWPFLKPGATLACISFHSLEDRTVVANFRSQGWCVHANVIRPRVDEVASNPRARSALLRFAHKAP